MKQAAHALGSRPPHIVASRVHARQVIRTVGSVQSTAPEPEPPPVQSFGQLALVSPVSQVPLPHTAPVFEPVLLPVFEPVLLPAMPQSAVQLLTSLAAQTPSPHVELLDASGVPSLLEAPPQLQATANDSALATTHTIPDEALIIMSASY